MRIWAKDYKLEDVSKTFDLNMAHHLNIETLELGEDFIKARMPVDERTRTPFGLLHGGASCVLAETLGSEASVLCIQPDSQTIVGIEINANHLRGVTEGYVTGIVKPIHIGKSIHVWGIEIVDDKERLVCVSRLTVAILAKRK